MCQGRLYLKSRDRALVRFYLPDIALVVNSAYVGGLLGFALTSIGQSISFIPLVLQLIAVIIASFGVSLSVYWLLRENSIVKSFIPGRLANEESASELLSQVKRFNGLRPVRLMRITGLILSFVVPAALLAWSHSMATHNLDRCAIKNSSQISFIPDLQLRFERESQTLIGYLTIEASEVCTRPLLFYSCCVESLISRGDIRLVSGIVHANTSGLLCSLSVHVPVDPYSAVSILVQRQSGLQEFHFGVMPDSATEDRSILHQKVQDRGSLRPQINLDFDVKS